MAEKRHLYFRFDVTDLSEDEIDGLAGEVSAQAEVSTLHAGVEAHSFDSAELRARLDAALETADQRSYLHLGDEDLDIFREELERAISGASRKPLVGNVICDDDFEGLAVFLSEADHGQPMGETNVLFQPYLVLYDPKDPDDGPLYLMYADIDGAGGTVFAPDCGDANELERRLTRALGDGGWTLDDAQEAVAAEDARDADFYGKERS